MYNLKYLLLVFFVVFSVSKGHAWGLTGHRTIAKIAENHISAKTKSEIQKLLENESMVMASTWMDEIKSDDNYNKYGDWHWVTIPDGKTYQQANKNENGDVVAGIKECKRILKSNADNETKKQYLKFLIHLVGDLHQPLHVGNGRDAGGNSIKIKWFYDPTDLHAIWDSRMINSKNWSYSELSENLQLEFGYSDGVQIGSTEDWAHEALQYRTQIYNYGSKGYVGYDYLYKNWPLVKSQLWKAGLRLAEVLDEIFCDC